MGKKHVFNSSKFLVTVVVTKPCSSYACEFSNNSNRIDLRLITIEAEDNMFGIFDFLVVAQ